MEVLQLIFSWPGAVIIVCLAVFVILVIFPDIRGLKLGYKDIKFEVPQPPASPSSAQATVETAAVEKGQDVEQPQTPPLLALNEAVKRRDRQAIESAVDKMRSDPPFDYTQDQLEAFRQERLLSAGFIDALPTLKQWEASNQQHVDASLYLARYYIQLDALGDAETHLTTAEGRAKDEKNKTKVYLLRSELISL